MLSHCRKTAKSGRIAAAGVAPADAAVDMARWLADAPVQRWPRGYLVSAPGARDDRIVHLREGRMRVYIASDDKELTLTYLSAGDLFSTHTRAYLRCESACAVWSMPTCEFARSLANQPGMLGMIMPVLGRILDNSIALIEDLAFRDVAGRLARFLLESARRQGAGGATSFFALDLSATEIALLLGCTRQTVSSLLQRMEREGIIARAPRRQIRLLHPDALRQWRDGGRSVAMLTVRLPVAGYDGGVSHSI